MKTLFVIGIFVIVIGLSYVIGKSLDDPVPTEVSITQTYRGSAKADLWGKSNQEIAYFISALTIFEVMLKVEGYGTWHEIELLALRAVPPGTPGGDVIERDIKMLLSGIKGKAKRIAEAQGKDVENIEIKKVVMASALAGLKAGANDAMNSEGQPKIPTMLDGR